MASIGTGRVKAGALNTSPKWMMVLGSALRNSKADQKLNMLNIAGKSNLKNGFELVDSGIAS